MLAKAFKCGNSTAIRIPKNLGIAEKEEFNIKKIGNNIILEPIKNNNWDDLFKVLKGFKGEIKRPDDLALESRDYE